MAFEWLWHKPPKKRPRHYRLRPAGLNVLVAEVRQQAAEIGHDGTGVSLVKIEKADLCRVDQDLTVVKIAMNKTGRAILISGRLHA